MPFVFFYYFIFCCCGVLLKFYLLYFIIIIIIVYYYFFDFVVGFVFVCYWFCHYTTILLSDCNWHDTYLQEVLPCGRKVTLPKPWTVLVDCNSCASNKSNSMNDSQEIARLRRFLARLNTTSYL